MTTIKLDAEGNQLPDDATDHASVLDQVSGLQFAVNVPSFDLSLPFEDAEAAVAALDYAGHQDWRLPTPHELFALVSFNDTQLQTDTGLFPDSEANWYWTGQATPWSPTYVYAVYFCQGHVGFLTRTTTAFVRPVRNATPTTPAA